MYMYVCMYTYTHTHTLSAPSKPSANMSGFFAFTSPSQAHHHMTSSCASSHDDAPACALTLAHACASHPTSPPPSPLHTRRGPERFCGLHVEYWRLLPALASPCPIFCPLHHSSFPAPTGISHSQFRV